MAKLEAKGWTVLPRRSARVREKPSLAIALVDPRPLTRRSIAEMLTKALPDSMTVAASSCEELIEIEKRPIASPNLIIVYIRSAAVTDACVQSALELEVGGLEPAALENELAAVRKHGAEEQT